MTYVTEDRQTDQRIKVYRLTTVLLDAAFELPTWCCIDQWSREAAIAAIERCQPILRLVQDAVRALGAPDDIDESSRATILFAEAVCLDCQREIDFVGYELLPYAN
jgi:hypothetical protein